MKNMDYTIGLEAGRAGQKWTATALTDRAKERTPEPVRFVDRPEALKFIKDSQSAGYRFSGAGLVDPEQRLVKNRYFIIGAGGELTLSDYVNFVLTSLSDQAFASTLAALSAETKKQIEDLIESNVEIFAAFKKELDETHDQISKGMQMSISYAADIRDAKGNNDHRAELIFDYGLSPRINWTVNASADYTDRKAAADSKGGRFATSFQGDLTKSNSAWGKTPIRSAFSGEGRWQTSQKPQYTFESKLTIPLASGIDLPVVYGYASRIAQIDQTNSEARLGLSIDISRLAQAFK